VTASANPRSIGDLLRRAAADRPGATAIVEGSSRISWSDLEVRVDRLAAALAAEGLADGDRVALQAPASVDFVSVYLAALQAGLVVVPVNPGYTAAELDHILSDSGARFLVTGSVTTVADASRLRSTHPALTGIAVAARSGAEDVPSVTDLARRSTSGGLHSDRTGEDLAVLLYTSGTSGRPKGAMLTVRALLANLAQFGALQPAPVSSLDVVYLPLPLFHVFGLNAGLGMALYFGATVVLSPKFDAAAALAAIVAERATVVVGAPLEFAVWANTDGFAQAFAGVRLGLSGSAPLPPELVGEYARVGIALFEGYGLTEAAPVITLNLVPDAAQATGWLEPKPGSIGRPLPGVEVRLLDSDGEIVEAGDLGTLEVRGDNLFSGYWPDAADGPRSSERADDDGWFTTGDLAVADDDGDLYLVGRRSDLILVNGFNVYPAEVEAVLSKLPGVGEVAVLGEPDANNSEAVIAYVVAATGATLDPDELVERASRSLARFKLPKRIIEVDALPHTATGKVQKWRLRPDRKREIDQAAGN
jgi:long-chain acyl-CoA synthetase